MLCRNTWLAGYLAARSNGSNILWAFQSLGISLALGEFLWPEIKAALHKDRGGGISLLEATKACEPALREPHAALRN